MGTHVKAELQDALGPSLYEGSNSVQVRSRPDPTWCGYYRAEVCGGESKDDPPLEEIYKHEWNYTQVTPL